MNTLIDLLINKLYIIQLFSVSVWYSTFFKVNVKESKSAAIG